jgi:hypothetical protein
MPRTMKTMVFNFDEVSDKATETMLRGLKGEPASKNQRGLSRLSFLIEIDF